MAVKHLTPAIDASMSIGTQISQFLSARHPMGIQESTVWPGYFDFHYVENPGAAWGLMHNVKESIRGPFFLMVSIIASLMILYYYFSSPAYFKLRQWALALIMGGALGNFFDRTRMQYVIDFISWHYQDVYHWPTFNIADSAISIGVVLLLIDSFVNPETDKTLKFNRS